MKLVLENANQISDGLWECSVAPHELQMLGSPSDSQGPRSIVMARSVSFDEPNRSLQIDLSGVSVLNLGTTSSSIIVETQPRQETPTEAHPTAEPSHIHKNATYGPGDTEYLRLVDNVLRGDAQAAAVRILEEVRQRYPGDLRRGKRSNFKNTPDNFWYVIVQPRAQSLSITVRGDVSRFSSDVLELKQDRPAYTRFILSKVSQVPEAMRIIEASKRK